MDRLLPPRLVFPQFTLLLEKWRAQGDLVLYDEDVERREVWRIFRKAIAHLRALADAGTLVLVVCPTPAVRFPDRDRLLDASTLSLEKPVPAPVSPPKRLDRLSGLEYAS